MMQVLDAGAEDFVEEEDSFEVLTDPKDIANIQKTLDMLDDDDDVQDVYHNWDE